MSPFFLSGYRDTSAFKLFCVDGGLLDAFVYLPVGIILDGMRFFAELKGAIAEQYLCQ